MYTDDEVKSQLDGAETPHDVDIAVASILDSGGMPDYITKIPWKPVVIHGGGHTLEIRVASDYAGLGQGYRLSRLTPYGAQDYADRIDSILPSKKLLNDIENASSPQIPYIDVKGAPWHIPLAQIGTPAAADAANDGASAEYAKRGIRQGDALTIGYKKAIVVAPNLDGSKVAIAGGRWPGGGIVQPFAEPHPSSYSDYSHGIVLVARGALLDGTPVDLRTKVFGSTDPTIYSLVSDQGRFDPVFPNAGPGSRAEFGSSGGGGGGGGGSTPKPSSPSSAPKVSPPVAEAPPTTSWGGVIARGLVALGVGGLVYYFVA